jgi:N-methylhydantoinase A
MRVGFDIGGTFTDVVAFKRDGGIRTAKVLSLLDRVGQDIVALIAEDAQRDPVELFVHGTTQASNAVIENRVAKTGLLTTYGFRDVLEIRNLRRPNVHDLDWDRLPPLVPRELRVEVSERILADGTIHVPFDVAQARAAIRALLDQKVEAIAVCLINSYVDPRHEQRLGALVSEMAPGIPVCLSSEIRPEIREYERTSTTVINASLIPVIDRYLSRLEATLAPQSPHLVVMQSSGGIMSAATARRKPCLMIESGPSAGVLAAAKLAREANIAKALSLDMGGTTAKACLIEDFAPLEKPEGEIGGGANIASRGYSGAGHALRVPGLDLVEVGAGGGSVAWLDSGGLLRVGPRSAGADPGPACYGRGGTEPTVTDANLALGYMNPSAIADATLPVDRDAAVDAIRRCLADPLGRDVLEVAYAITQLASSLMMRAVRAVSTERGRDPRDFTMIAFGGAGPMHAASLAANAGIKHVVVPLFPGLFSALGLLLADYRLDYVTSVACRVEQLDAQAMRETFERMRAMARHEMEQQGISAAALRFDLRADLKYAHQLSELIVPFDVDHDEDMPTRLAHQFTEAHEQAFGYVLKSEPIELVSVRLRAAAPAGDIDFARLVERAPLAESAGNLGHRQAYFGPERGFIETPIRRHGDIGDVERGPLIVEEPDTTVVVPPGWTVFRDRLGALHLQAE